jgi:hypothetical protein
MRLNIFWSDPLGTTFFGACGGKKFFFSGPRKNIFFVCGMKIFFVCDENIFVCDENIFCV